MVLVGREQSGFANPLHDAILPYKFPMALHAAPTESSAAISCATSAARFP
jgi:hypothetical protein